MPRLEEALREAAVALSWALGAGSPLGAADSWKGGLPPVHT